MEQTESFFFRRGPGYNFETKSQDALIYFRQPPTNANLAFLSRQSTTDTVVPSCDSGTAALDGRGSESDATESDQSPIGDAARQGGPSSADNDLYDPYYRPQRTRNRVTAISIHCLMDSYSDVAEESEEGSVVARRREESRSGSRREVEEYSGFRLHLQKGIDALRGDEKFQLLAALDANHSFKIALLPRCPMVDNFLVAKQDYGSQEIVMASEVAVQRTFPVEMEKSEIAQALVNVFRDHESDDSLSHIMGKQYSWNDVSDLRLRSACFPHGHVHSDRMRPLGMMWGLWPPAACVMKAPQSANVGILVNKRSCILVALQPISEGQLLVRH